MALLKEDGSLDVERIDSLPLEEHKKEVESLNQAQFKEYYSKRIIKDSQPPVKVIKVKAPNGVDAMEFLDMLEKKYGVKKDLNNII